MAELNATQGSLLGFLHGGPKTGWDLLQQVEGGLARFWNITSSHVYRELRALEERGLVKASARGARDKRPFTITPSGKRAFRKWITEDPAPEQMRFPLLVRLWFSRHLDRETLERFVDRTRDEHATRLALYREVEPSMTDQGRASVVRFGIAYEEAVLGWLDETARTLTPSTSSR